MLRNWLLFFFFLLSGCLPFNCIVYRTFSLHTYALIVYSQQVCTVVRLWRAESLPMSGIKCITVRMAKPNVRSFSDTGKRWWCEYDCIDATHNNASWRLFSLLRATTSFIYRPHYSGTFGLVRYGGAIRFKDDLLSWRIRFSSQLERWLESLATRKSWRKKKNFNGRKLRSIDSVHFIRIDCSEQ